MNKKNYILALIATSLVAFGCKKSYLDTNPSTAITDATLYTTAAGCRSVLDGMAMNMNTNQASFSLDGNASSNSASDFGQKSQDLMDDCSGQDLLCYGGNYDWYFNFAYQWTGPISAGNQQSSTAWYLYYKLINDANLILANVGQAKTADPNEIAEIKGEAYAYRAWAYYKLSVYYSQTYTRAGALTTKGVPIYTTPTTSETKGNPRGTVADVYARIGLDLDSAINLISNSGIATPYNGNKSYISLATTYGIAAEVALVKGDWANAETYSDLAINEAGGAGKLMDSTTYKAGFNTNTNSEWMWASAQSETQIAASGLQNFMSFVDVNAQGYCGYICFRRAPTYFLALIPNADVRKRNWDTRKNQVKFHLAPGTTGFYADMLYMRISEMFLIKAEAQAQQNKESDAIATLETLVQKRNPGYTYAATPYFKTALPSNPVLPTTRLLEEIYLQRRIELYMEGFAFSDLKRLQKPLARPTGSGNFDITTCRLLSVPANDNMFQFKLSQREMDNNKSFTGADQNP